MTQNHLQTSSSLSWIISWEGPVTSCYSKPRKNSVFRPNQPLKAAQFIPQRYEDNFHRFINWLKKIWKWFSQQSPSGLVDFSKPGQMVQHQLIKWMKKDVSDREECEDRPKHALGGGEEEKSEEKRERVEHWVTPQDRKSSMATPFLPISAPFTIQSLITWHVLQWTVPSFVFYVFLF